MQNLGRFYSQKNSRSIDREGKRATPRAKMPQQKLEKVQHFFGLNFKLSSSNNNNKWGLCTQAYPYLRGRDVVSDRNSAHI